jgi:HlyD family secretion protein
MKGRTFLIIAAVAVLAGGVYFGLPALRRARRANAAPALVQGEVTAIRAVSSVESSGAIEPQQSASLFLKTTGTIASVAVKIGDHVKPGDVLMTLDPASAPANIIQAQSELLTAQKALDDLLHPSATDQATALANAQQAVSNAEDALTKAQEDLQDLQKLNTSYYEDQVALKEKALLTAQQNAEVTDIGSLATALQNAKNDLVTKTNWFNDAKSAQEQCPGCTTVFVNSAGRRMSLADAEAAYNAAVNTARIAQINYEQALSNNHTSVENAQDALDTARANLAAYLAGKTKPDAAELRAKTTAVAVAEANLADAQDKLAHVTDGADPDDIKVANLRVQSAQVTLDSLTLRAPFEGDVLAINYQPGDPASQTTAAIVLTNRAALHVDVSVDENDIGQVSAGDLVSLTVDALPDSTLSGQVAAIESFGETVQGLVRYNVRINLTSADPRLLLNMTANAVIVTDVQDQALSVPLNAVQYDDQGEYVNLVRPDGSLLRVKVTTSETQGDRVVVVGEVKPGDHVEIIAAAPASAGGGLFGRGQP